MIVKRREQPSRRSNMAEFTLQEIIDATSGTCKGDVSLQFKDISTDTRTIEALSLIHI